MMMTCGSESPVILETGCGHFLFHLIEGSFVGELEDFIAESESFNNEILLL